MASEDDRGPAEGAVSRRTLLGAAGLGAAAAAGPALAAPGAAVAGRRFRGMVSDAKGSRIEALTLLPLGPRDCLVRMQATAVSYTMVGAVLGASRTPLVIGQGGVGVCEAVGSQVKRVEVGDRVLISATAQCGWCYQCLHGRTDWCQFSQTSGHPFARTAAGVEVTPRGGIGGTSELTFAPEEHVTPIFTDLPAAPLALIVNQFGCGFAAGRAQAPIEAGSDVAVFGAGPVGMGAVISARVAGAARIVVVEPIAARRETARRLGATHVLDPNAMPAKDLVETIREICKGRTDRLFAGGRRWGTNVFGQDGRGADFVIEAVGATRFPPKAEKAPDDTGVLPLHQAWEVTRAGGHVTYMGAAQGEVSFPAIGIALNGRSIHAAQMGGQHPMRDLPRFVEMMERRIIDLEALITPYPLDRAVEAHQAVADRSILAGAVVFG